MVVAYHFRVGHWHDVPFLELREDLSDVSSNTPDCDEDPDWVPLAEDYSQRIRKEFDRYGSPEDEKSTCSTLPSSEAILDSAGPYWSLKFSTKSARSASTEA